MIIIVEGIDRVGKTTLCNKLKDAGCKIFKDDVADFLKDRTNEEKAVMAASSMNSIISMCKLFKNEVIVLDRFHATECIYGCLERNQQIVEAFDRFFDIEGKLEELNEDYLYVFVEPVDINMSSKKHGKSLRLYQSLFCELYKHIDQKNKMKTDFYNLDEAVCRIQEKIEKRK